MGVLSAQPATHKLKDIASWYIRRLPPAERAQLLQAVEAASAEGRPLKVGTMCSGTDSPVVVLSNLEKALCGKLKVEHTFSSEFDPKKQAWIKDNFPGLQYLFGDVTQLKSGKAWNHLTNKLVPVPAVDIVIAGFVCKSVSTENNEREKFGNCIREASGKTGETFNGVMGYVKKFQPPIVICENVQGLTKKTSVFKGKGRNRKVVFVNPPVVNDVKAAFKKAGYAFDHKVLDSRDYLLPQRRHRCWMWAFNGNDSQTAVQETTKSVVALASQRPFGFNKLFRMAGVAGSVKKILNPRQRNVVATAQQKLKNAGKDIVVDVAKSAERAPVCDSATPCIVPNSLPYRLQTHSILTPEQVNCVQGIYKSDFPALAKYAKEKASLARDLAGNAFSTTVCMAVVISCLTHAPLARMTPAPSTPPRIARASCGMSPPRLTAKRTRTNATQESPVKRLKRVASI